MVCEMGGSWGRRKGGAGEGTWIDVVTCCGLLVVWLDGSERFFLLMDEKSVRVDMLVGWFLLQPKNTKYLM